MPSTDETTEPPPVVVGWREWVALPQATAA